MLCFCLFWCDLEQNQLCRWQGSVLHNWKPVPQIAVKYRPWRRVVSCIFSLKASCVKWALWVGRLLVVCLYRTPWRVQTECLDHADLLQHVWRPKLLVSSLSLSVLLNSAGMLLLLARPSTGSIELFQVYFMCPHYTHTSLMVCTSPMVCLFGFVWF